MHYFYGFMAVVFISIVLLLFYNETIQNAQLLISLKEKIAQNPDDECDLKEYSRIFRVYKKQYAILKPFAKFLKIADIKEFS